MRTYAISTMFLVLALFSGACAGRQVRTRPIPAPPTAEAVSVAAVEADPAPAPSAEPAPLEEQAAAPAVEPIIEETPAITASRLLAEHDASNRAAAEKLHRAHVPASPAMNDEIVAAMRPAKRIRRKTAPAVEDAGLPAVVGSVSATPPIAESPAAPAAPSILPPQGAPTVITAGPAVDRTAPQAPDPAAYLVPDASSVRTGHEIGTVHFYGVLMALFIGVLIAVTLDQLERRRLRSLAERPYDHLPDGTVLIQQVVNGELVTLNAFAAEVPSTLTEADIAAHEERMENIEKTWHASGDAMDHDEDPSQPGVPKNRRFDLTDAFDDEDAVPTPLPIDDPTQPMQIPQPDETVADAPPVPSAAPASPIPTLQPEIDDATRLASGSARIISSSDEVRTASGVADAPDPPKKSGQAPETYPSVIYDATNLS